MNSRKYSRTLEEAFGPGHRSSIWPLHPMPEPRARLWQDVALWCCAVLAIAVIVWGAK